MNKDSAKKVVLTEADADAIIGFLKEMYAYRKKDIENTEESMAMFKNAVVESDGQGKFKDFTEKVYENGLKTMRKLFQEETLRFNNAILLLTAGSTVEGAENDES